MTDGPAQSRLTGLEVAIVGMAGRFPGAADIDEFWRNLKEGTEAIRFFTEDELRDAGVDPALIANPRYVRAAGVLTDADLFDAGFFQMTPREAETTDPQHRLFLECAWTALEHAGYAPSKYAGTVGVYGGTSPNTYLLDNLLESESESIDSPLALPIVFGNSADYLTTRVSYKLNLTGPSIDVQTSCSTSLVAVHLACQGLLGGECDLALAGGASVSVPLKTGYMYQEDGIYSPDGHCRAFDAAAQGTVGGRGVAVVVLRRLSDALAAGDTVHAVIKGSAINNDGSAKVGYAAPSVDGQAQVIRSALAAAGVEPDSISYIETHGTATPLGDAVEVAGLTKAFRASTSRVGFCRLGSLKTNVGHLDAAAGVSGLIKASLAVEHGEIPPSLHFERPNPKLHLDTSPFQVNATLTSWVGTEPRRAGVSSFGIGGTNAHVILEEAPVAERGGTGRPCQLLVLSARTRAALDTMTTGLTHHLRQSSELNLADVAFTLQTGREDFAHRRMLVCRSAAEAANALDTPYRTPVETEAQVLEHPEVVFMFPGEGAQHEDMARGLYEAHGVFRFEVDRCAKLLEPLLGVDVRSLMYSETDRPETPTADLRETRLAQPALFVTEYALARQWMHWGIHPRAMIGHGLGEYVAACLAGVFTVEAALTLIAARGAHTQQTPSGSMRAVSQPSERVEPFAAQLQESSLQPPQIPFVSSVTGDWIRDEEATDSRHWARQPRESVRFAAGLGRLLDEPTHLLLEVGPGTTLTTVARKALQDRQVTVAEQPPRVIASLRHAPDDQEDDEAHLLRAVGRLWLSGARIDWQALHAPVRRRRVTLPTYPFERQRYWVESGSRTRLPAAARGVQKKVSSDGWFYVRSWRRTASLLLMEPTVDLTGTRWLLFLDEEGLAEQLAARLEDAGAFVSRVTPGVTFEYQGDGRYTLDPTSPGDYDLLLQRVQQNEGMPDRVVHWWGAAPTPDTSWNQHSARSFYSLLFLAQATSRLPHRRPVQITQVTRHVHAVTGDEELVPERAAAVGLCTGISQELEDVSCLHLDIDASGSDPVSTAQVEQLLAELTTPSPHISVAHRNGHRWVPDVEPVRLAPPQRSRLRDGGCYLIIGGLGAVGLEIADRLARRTRGTVILTGRSEFPEPATWDAWLSTHDGDENSRRIRRLQTLERAGAKIVIARADATDPDQMRSVFERAEKRFGGIDGVVHAAGAPKTTALLQEISRDEIERQIQPKLRGLQVLEVLLSDRQVDFCVVLSSLSSVLGALGLLGYVAAHNVVDAFVTRHNRQGGAPWTSANWDHWLTWKEPELKLSSHESALFLSPEEGAEAFLQVVESRPGTQWLISTGDLQPRVDRWTTSRTKITSTGSAGEAGATAPHAGPDVTTGSPAPRNAVERALADSWTAVLGVGPVGVDDSFFELGGDSVLALQVVAKVRSAGLQITPGQIFQHPTVAELAAVTARTDAAHVVRGEEEGSVPLTPIQRWFFERKSPNPHHFNMAVIVDVDRAVDEGLLESVFAALVRHHDALRLRFHRTTSGIEQVHAGAETVSVTRVDLTHLAADKRGEAMEAEATRAHQKINIEMGPTMQVVVFDLGPGQPRKLLWIIHHLLVDAVSWRILTEDLRTALDQRGGGQPITLPAKTSSYRQWAEALERYAQSDTLRGQLAHWSQLPIAVPDLPRDHHVGENDFGSSRTRSVTLDQDETRALLQVVSQAYGTRMDEVLLTALVRVLTSWTGSDSLLIDLEGHGRLEIAPGLDLTRTVGWFTTIYPTYLDLSDAPDLGTALKTIKAQVGETPQQGIGYGALRYLTRDPETAARIAVSQPQVSFLYLGQFDQATPSGLLQDHTGLPCSPDRQRDYVLEIAAFVAARRLRVQWSYSTRRHQSETIEALAEAFRHELRRIIELCRSPHAGNPTPDDFPAARVSQSDLDTLFSQLRRGASGAQGE